MKKYDYLIVGAGLFGSVIAYRATRMGKRCLVVDRRNHLGDCHRSNMPHHPPMVLAQTKKE